MLGTYALTRSGLLGMATYYLFMFSMLATILFGIRVGMGALLTSMALIGLFGLRVHLGQTTFPLDMDAYMTDPTVWVTRLLSIGLFGSIVIVCLGRLYRVLADSIEARGAATSRLQDANRRLTKEVDFRARTERELRSSRERVRNLSTHLQETIEEERIRISRELHDELGQSLTGMRMQLGWMESRLNEDGAGVLETCRSMTALLDQTIASIKRVCAELRPSIMDDLGLSATLEWLAEDFESRTGIRTSVNVDPPDIFGDARHSIAIFRITQEALTNVARHARATEVAITLRGRKDELVLDVRDNGRGIEKGDLQRTRSFGVLGIQERVSLLGGSFSIQGLPGQGTSLHVRLPSEAGTEDDANPDR
jgi:signal transduction histidine kinase